jgi:hypothetical protein
LLHGDTFCGRQREDDTPSNESTVVAVKRNRSSSAVVRLRAAAFGTIPSIDVLDDDNDDVDCRCTVVAPPVDARDDVRPRIASILPVGTGVTSVAPS